jgi:hypothetical protein
MYIREPLTYFNEKFNEKEHYNIKSLTPAPKVRTFLVVSSNFTHQNS